MNPSNPIRSGTLAERKALWLKRQTSLLDHPLSLYAASKRANELIAHAYSHLYGLATTGLRFFTLYGPWGRPGMALFNFTRSIISGEKVQFFNHARHCRDFTYIDDIVEAILRVIDKPAMANDAWAGEDPNLATSSAPWRIYNVGIHRPVRLMDLVRSLERSLGKRADLEFLPLQPGDLPDTYADMNEFADEFGYSPSTSVEVGVPSFVNWYREYYNIASETHENLASSEEPRIEPGPGVNTQRPHTFSLMSVFLRRRLAFSGLQMHL
jgi:UDP-glucuronate 4-epimerase